MVPSSSCQLITAVGARLPTPAWTTAKLHVTYLTLPAFCSLVIFFWQKKAWGLYSPTCRSYTPLQSRSDTARPSNSWCLGVQGAEASHVWRGRPKDNHMCCQGIKEDLLEVIFGCLLSQPSAPLRFIAKLSKITQNHFWYLSVGAYTDILTRPHKVELDTHLVGKKNGQFPCNSSTICWISPRPSVKQRLTAFSYKESQANHKGDKLMHVSNCCFLFTIAFFLFIFTFFVF